MNSVGIKSVENFFLNFITELFINYSLNFYRILLYSLLKIEKKKLITRKIASELFVLSICHELLLTNNKSTKRNLFYMNVKLFGSQKYLDFIIESLSKKIGLSRSQMNIEASNKSLIYGDVMLSNPFFNSISCLNSQNGVILPSGFTFCQDDLRTIKFILVIEKDATFQQLIEKKFCDLFSPCILITAKGFPDFNCRFLLKETEESAGNTPVFCLVDADPYGLSIYYTYKYGSKKVSLQNLNQEILRSRDIKLVGLLATDIEKFQFQRSELMTLSVADNKILKGLKEREFYKTDDDIKIQTECFLRLQLKAEIQSLNSLAPDYLMNEYLYKKIIRHGITPSISLY